MHISPSRRDLRTLNGYLTALPSPFLPDDDPSRRGIDEAAFSSFCDWQISQGISGLIVCGTTGEAPTLSDTEQERLVRLAVETSAGRVPIIAGAGSNATAHAVELARLAESAGADGILAVVPYYNKPSQEGLCRHFRTIADSVGIPLILYDVPGRTGCGLTLDTIARLAECPGIIGLKDAAGDLTRPAQLRSRLGSAFRLLTGEDAAVPAYLAQGGDGCISVTSNVAPRLCAHLHAAFTAGDIATMRRLAALLAPLTAALFTESNPVPVKHALSLQGRMADRVRLPLCEASQETRARLLQALSDVGLHPFRANGHPARSAA
jgi:4-hydroxy-tetrahydrodipicolinate synthase